MPETTQPKQSRILVTGDVVREIYIYQGDRVFPAQQGKTEPYFGNNCGGAMGLYELISKAHPSGTVWGLEEQALDTLQPVYALWTACEGGTKKEHDDAGKKNKPAKVWRVAKSLGYSLGIAQPRSLAKSKAAGERNEVVVIDDAGLAFRTQPAMGAWPAGISRGHSLEPDCIIHKMANPICSGDLWRELIGGSRDPRKNLVVIVAADELRRAGAAISRGLSWETTLSDLCRELNDNPIFKPLLSFPSRLIVNFGCVGAIWFKELPNLGNSEVLAQHRATLIYDPTLPEGGWKTKLADDHDVYGHLNTFTAAIAAAAAEANLTKADDLNAAIKRGLKACRLQRLRGHGEVSGHEKNPRWKPGPPLNELVEVLSPTRKLSEDVQTILKKICPQEFQVIVGPSHRIKPEDADVWTLAALAENPQNRPLLPLYGLAHLVALYGEPALRHIPHDHFGALLSVDRAEIETLRSLSHMISTYEKSGHQKQPLCLAAFGPPGAGKSFGIKEIAPQAISRDKKVPILEFNLSQYNDSKELIGAFHQVRDECLKGVTPVVFWDEFDSHDYKWLQYLLAPMQDGSFQENGHTHTLGKCVFVFAGGTSWDFEHFGPAPMPDKTDKADEAARKSLKKRYDDDDTLKKAEEEVNLEFRKKKGPDFISRLDGHINVLGPNRRLNYNWESRLWDIPDPNDITFPVRRALLLRVFLGMKKDDEPLAIDRDLLRAFLLVDRYRHGSRSLEKISRPLAGTGIPFQRAHMPPPQVLEEHLKTKKEFDEIYHGHREFFSGDKARNMAAAISDYYISRYSQQRTAPRTAEDARQAFDAKTANPDPWEQWDIATNLAAAHRLPYVLSLAGLCLQEGTATDDEKKEACKQLEMHLKRLAKEEHDLWMEFHVANGWRQADETKLKELKGLKETNKTAYDAEIKRLKREERIHTLLMPFDKLDESEKDKDHKAIMDYPSVVGLVEWKIAFIDNSNAKAQSPEGASERTDKTIEKSATGTIGG